MQAKAMLSTHRPPEVIDLTLEDTDSEMNGEASSSASSSATFEYISSTGYEIHNASPYIISPTFERSEQRRRMKSANKDVNTTMARLQDQASRYAVLNDTSSKDSRKRRSTDDTEDESMPEDHPFKSMKASRKSAVCVRSVPSASSSICEITDPNNPWSVPSRQGLPWRLQSKRKPRAVYFESLPADMHDEVFGTAYLESFRNPRFEKKQEAATYRLPFLNRNLLRFLFLENGEAVPTQAKPVLLHHLLPNRIYEERQNSTARLGRILKTNLTAIQAEKRPPFESGEYVCISLLLSDGSDTAAHRVAWKVNRRVSVTRAGAITFEPPITEPCLVPRDWATCVCELRFVIADSQDVDDRPFSPQFALCRGGIYEDLTDGRGVKVADGIVAQTMPGSFEWTFDFKLKLRRNIVNVKKSPHFVQYFWEDTPPPPVAKATVEVTGWWCPLCTISDCLKYEIWTQHLNDSHWDQVGESGYASRNESYPRNWTIKLERPAITKMYKPAPLVRAQTLSSDVQTLVRRPVAQAAGVQKRRNGACQNSESSSSVGADEVQEICDSECTSTGSSEAKNSVSGQDLTGVLATAVVKQEPVEGQTWRVRDPQRYVSHSSWTVPGTTMDLMGELRTYFKGDNVKSYVGQETANLIWTQHHLTDRMRLMSCVWNQWREEKGPIGKANTDGYMHEFVRRYASFFRIAGLRLEFERLVMDFLWERRLVTLDLALGSVALYHQLVLNE